MVPLQDAVAACVVLNVKRRPSVLEYDTILFEVEQTPYRNVVPFNVVVYIVQTHDVKLGLDPLPARRVFNKRDFTSAHVKKIP